LSVRWKIVLLLSIVLGMLSALALGVGRWIVYPSFLALEQRQTRDDVSRVVEGIQREVDHLTLLCNDWSAWTDTWNFVQNRNAEFIKQNLVAETFANNGLDLLLIADTADQFVWEGIFNRRDKAIEHDSALFTRLLQGGRLTGHTDAASICRGLVMTERGPLLVASRPIMTSENTGPIRGTLIVGRFLDERQVQQLIERTRVEFALWPANSAELPPAARRELALLGPESPLRVDSSDSRRLSAYTLLRDVSGQPALLLRADVPRLISQQGRSAILWAQGTLLSSGAIVMALLWLQLHRWVVRPLERLRRHAAAVGADGSLSQRLNMRRRDEIGELARELDRMVGLLEESRARMLKTAHRAGMAQIASEVLHNVGNALNTVQISAEIMEEKLRASKVPNLARAVALLQEHREDAAAFLAADPRRRQVIGYLTKLSELLAAEQAQLAEELEALQAKVHHIGEIIAAQQNRATGARLIEGISLPELIDQCLHMHEGALRAAGVQVERDYRGPAHYRVEKTRLMQVLVNLIKNAVESLTQVPEGQRRLRVAMAPARGAGVEIRVEDTGVGIAPENLTRIFQGGMSTKPGGHGLGLHYCANAVASMGGSIRAVSRGRGAAMIIQLPLPEHEAAA